jgi:PAS domain-containing protein
MTEAAHALEMSPIEMLLIGVSAVFESLGRGLVCLGPDFHIVHASEGLDRIAGAGAVEAILGKPVEEVFGPELFGPHGTMRRALQAGERREDWSATLDTGRGSPRRISLSVAPIQHHPSGICDPWVAHVIVLRPAEESGGDPAGGPTVLTGLVARSAAKQPLSPEREQLRTALEAHRWRREETARALGVSRTTLWRRMRELGLAG